MRTKLKLRVSKAALFARINRRLAQQDERLRVSRSERARQDLGDYYIVDVRRNFLVGGHIDPVQLARELGVLQGYEEAEDLD